MPRATTSDGWSHGIPETRDRVRLKRGPRMADRQGMASARRLAWLLACAIAAHGAVPDARAQSCQVAKPSGPVSILILDSPQKVEEFAASVRDARVAARDRGTVIFDDGRVVTADVDAATRQLNRLGWGNRAIEVVASFPLRPVQAPRRG